MANNLVIVESPAKAKTIGKFLGSDYIVKSSYGHIRDLKTKGLSIDVKENFKPDYEIPAEKTDLVKDLKEEADKADIVWLASDEDREGEAISWHLSEVLKLNKEKSRRIVFHEITKEAILHAIETPREIDQNLVNAQQARRVLDRIVGFELSPVLWKKVKPDLSAGRVQSVTVRLIVDREREIEAFKAETSYRVVAHFNITNAQGKEVVLKAELPDKLKTKEEVLGLLNRCKGKQFIVKEITKRTVKRSPAPPFTTSTLQQEAARKLGYSVAQTMRLAQGLYEDGKITYMRTDSFNLSSLAINTAKQVIGEMAGEEYVQTRQFHTTSKGAQEAHEAIRPTYINNRTIEGTQQEKRLYDLIWKRTVASQMADALIDKTSVVIAADGVERAFHAEGETIKFDGFLKVYIESKKEDDDSEEVGSLPPLSEGMNLGEAVRVVADERFTQRPPRYSEASLVHKLEELGIGRPSTYAPTISVIQNRGYVEKSDLEGVERSFEVITLYDNHVSERMEKEKVGADKGKLVPTDTAFVVNDFLTGHFNSILDYNFTASVEKEFDEVAEGKVAWQTTISKFYEEFHPKVKDAEENSERQNGARELGIDPETGKPVIVKIARFGPVVQIGETDDRSKPRFASLLKNQRMDTITLKDALALFQLPRTVGDFEEKPMTVNCGKFGPYVLHDKKFYALEKDDDPMTITHDRAVELILKKRETEANRSIATFDLDGKAVEIQNGRFGPYFSYDGVNYKIPKGTDAKELTLEDCKKLMEEQADKAEKKKKPKGRGKSKE